MRVTCETAAQCERLAAQIEPLVQDSVAAAVYLTVALVVALATYRELQKPPGAM